MDTIFILSAFFIDWVGGHALDYVAVRLSKVQPNVLGIGTFKPFLSEQPDNQSRAIVETVADNRRSWKIAR